MIEITKFKTGDLLELQSLIHATIKAFYPSVYLPAAVDYFLKYHSGDEIINRSKNASILILRDNDKMLGTGFLSGNEIGGVYVHPDYQRLGYGRMIVENLLQIAGINGLKFVHLDSTPIAKGLYEKLGFHVTESVVQIVNDVPLPYFKMEMELNF